VSALDADGDAVYAGGLFTRIGGESRFALAGLDPESGAATAFNPALPHSVTAMDVAGGVAYLALETSLNSSKLVQVRTDGTAGEPPAGGGAGDTDPGDGGTTDPGPGTDTGGGGGAPTPQPAATPTPAAPTPVPGRLTFAGLPKTLKVDAKGRLAVKLACAASPCRGTLTLSAKQGKKTVKLASATYSVAAGKSATIKLKLSTAGRKLLKKGALKASLSAGATSKAVKLKKG
jgi:hypothetical protein